MVRCTKDNSCVQIFKTPLDPVENTAKTALLFKMAAKQAMKENLQCTSKYGHLRITQDICHVRMTDIEGFLTIFGHSDNLLNNKIHDLLTSNDVI